MRSIVFEDNRNSLRYWIHTWIITTYCMNKRGFDSAFCASFFALSSVLSLALFFSLFFSSIPPRLLTVFFFFLFFFLYPTGLEPHTFRISLAYQSLFYTTTVVVHYEVQLRIIPGKFIYIFLDSFTFQKIYITISFLICLMHVSRSTKTCITFLHYWLPGE